MKILITGADGMLARALIEYLKSENEIIALNKKQLDVTKFEDVYRNFCLYKPDLVINCAGYTDVEKAQKEYLKCKKVNILGAKNVAKACEKIDSILIQISSDYVFDGEKKAPYTPIDKPNPLNNYGKTKFLAEKMVQKYLKKHYILRMQWLYGDFGNNFIKKIIKKVKNKDVLNIVTDEFGSPTSTKEIAKNILKVLSMPFGIYHMASYDYTSRYDFTREILRLLNLKTQLKKTKLSSFKTSVKRPKFAVLEPDITLNSWIVQLEEYLKNKPFD